MAEPLAIDGLSLTIDEVVEVAREGRPVTIAKVAYGAMLRSRAVVELLLEHGAKVYGLTTGFGVLRDVAIKNEDTRRLQQNLIRSHACGVGQPFAEDVCRAAMLLRANTLCRGNSGVRPLLVETLVMMLNDGVYPWIPQKGSLGASGDLAPLSHLALLLMGDPLARYYPRADRSGLVEEARSSDFQELPADLEGFERLAQHEGWSFRPVELQAKEGLALNNGTQVMAAVACLTVFDARRTMRLSELAGAISLEAQRGVRDAYDPRLHGARDLSHQAATARRVLTYCEGSQILDLYLNSANLQRARIHLVHATKAMKQAELELADRGIDPPVALMEAERGLSQVEEGLRGVIPRDLGGNTDKKYVRRWASAPPRDQIRLFNERLGPVRSLALDLLRTTQQFNFPRSSAVDRAVTELVECIAQLNSAVPDAPLVQDDYSFRCFPQVLACAYRCLDHVQEVLDVEINSATDNPLIFPPEPPTPMDADAYTTWLQATPERVEDCRSAVIGGGNFHGEPLALTMDYLCMALAESANIAERRIAHLVDHNMSRGLPPFLIESSGLNSGFMIPQYTAAALVSENKVLSHPASVDSIPTSANAEDHVSMGTISARKCSEVLGNVRIVVAIELLTAYQALKFREPLEPGRGVQRAIDVLRAAGIERYEADRVMYPDINKARSLLSDPALLGCLLPLE